MNQEEREIWTAVQEMNGCWTCGSDKELARLNNYFHETMVAFTPTDRLRIEGKEACIAGWSSFTHSARIDSWLEKEAKISIYDKTAIVTYYYEMKCNFGGDDVHLEGREMLVLVNESGRWQVVADQFSPYPM